MGELDALRVLYRFNARVRRRYLETLLHLPAKERLKDRGASRPSLQDIYLHVLDGLHWWLEYVPQDRVAAAVEFSGRDLSPERLRSGTYAADKLALDFLDRLVESDQTREMVCHVPGGGIPPGGTVPHRGCLVAHGRGRTAASRRAQRAPLADGRGPSSRSGRGLERLEGTVTCGQPAAGS